MEQTCLPYPYSGSRRKSPRPYMKQVAYLVDDPERDGWMGYGSTLGALQEWLAALHDVVDGCGLVDPILYGGYLVGWVEMTPAERKRSDEASKRAKDAAAKRKMAKEQRERAEYEKLRKKFEVA